MRGEQIVQPGADKSVLNFLGRAAGSHALWQCNRSDRFADIGSRLQIARIELQRGFLDLSFKIIRQTAAKFSFDDRSRLAIRDAEKSGKHLIGGDGITVTRQHFRMRAARNDFAVDEYAIAVENDKVKF